MFRETSWRIWKGGEFQTEYTNPGYILSVEEEAGVAMWQTDDDIFHFYKPSQTEQKDPRWWNAHKTKTRQRK